MVSRVGPYQIESELGRGGMGVVYLATDQRLGRRVAIKSLPAELASDPARLERFEREARTLAQLNHPNLAGIHGVEEQDGSQYLVLEYVAGETLADRLDRGPLPVDEAVELAIQVAAGIEAAHEAGVIHRDLKPANIILTPDGEAKVLDFGLARTDDGGQSSTGMLDSPTLTNPPPHPQHSPTIAGAILGTAAYMSPEQARGRRVDKRTDIWSFGVVLYEMLTGSSPFHGETATDSIGAVLHKDADLERLPREAPISVRRVLERCLVRDRSLRYRDIGDVRIELVRPSDLADVATMAGAGAGGSSSPRHWVTGVVAAASLAVGAGIVWFGTPAPPSPPRPVVHADLALPADTRLAHAFLPGVAISRDGQTIAFAASEPPEGFEAGVRALMFPGDMMIRRLGDPEPVPVAGASGGNQPVFSPDGKRLAYMHPERRRIESIPVGGGSPIPLLQIDDSIFGLDWTADGRIVFGTRDGLRSIPEAGGPETVVTSLEQPSRTRMHAFPHVLPGDRGTLYLTPPAGGNLDRIELMVLDHATGESRELMTVGSNARYVGGAIICAISSILHAVPFDLETLRITGSPRPLGISVIQSLEGPNIGLQNGAAQFAVSDGGTLAYAPGGVFPELARDVGWVSRDGEFESVGFAPRGYVAPRLAPNGKRVVAATNYALRGGVWVRDPERGVTQAVERGAAVVWVSFGPGDDEVTYRTNPGSAAIRIARIGDSSERREIELPDDGSAVLPGEWSPDRRHLVGVNWAGTRTELVAWSESEGWMTLTDTPELNEMHPAVSPDGRWMAYSMVPVDSEDRRVFLRPFLRDGPTIPVTDRFGTAPVWSHDGTELFFIGEHDAEAAVDRLEDGTTRRRWVFSMSFTADGDVATLGRPEPLFVADGFGQTVPIRAWDVAPDGRFLMGRRVAPEDFSAAVEAFYPDRIRIVQNWTSTLDTARRP